MVRSHQAQKYSQYKETSRREVLAQVQIFQLKMSRWQFSQQYIHSQKKFRPKLRFKIPIDLDYYTDFT